MSFIKINYKTYGNKIQCIYIKMYYIYHPVIYFKENQIKYISNVINEYIS